VGVVAASALLPAAASAAITFTEGTNTVTTPRFELNFGNAIGVSGGDGNVERLEELKWRDSATVLGGDIANNGGGGFCPTGSGPGEFWGQSYGDLDGTPPGPVVAGTVGDWVPIGKRTVELRTDTPTSCSGSTPPIPMRTRYSFYDSSAGVGSMIRIERRFGFGSGFPVFGSTHGLRAYVPRLPLSYDQVVYPNATSSALVTRGTSGPSHFSDWDRTWVALNASGSGSGMLILRDPANTTTDAQVVTDNDGSSASNNSGVTFPRPTGGWQAPILETEYLCFYDATSWPVGTRSPSNLPSGCSVRPLPINTSPPTVSGGAGNPFPGANLSASPGTWDNQTGPFGYQWQRCDDVSCTDIGGATSQNYTATNADFGKSLKVAVTATAANGEQDTVTSSLAGVILGTVYLNSTATPLSDARVQACRTPSGGCRTAVTDSSGEYEIRVPQSGTYALKALPPASSNAVSDSDEVTVVDETAATAPDLILQAPQPPPPSTTVGGAGFRGTAPGGGPIVHWDVPFNVKVHVSAPPPGTQVTAKLETPNGDLDPIDFDFTPDVPSPDPDDGDWEFDFPSTNPLHGNGFIRITITPPTPEEPDGEILFPVYIDPSGFVKTTDGTGLAGATVTLYRSDFPGGPFTVVPDGSDVMSPSNRENPDTTDASGHFGWDVIAGYYKVRAEKSGCHAPGNAGQAFVETSVMEIPPPVTDLDIRLDCPATDNQQPPARDTTPPDTRISKGPKKKTKSAKAKFEFSSTESGSTFECAVDKGAFKACTSPLTVKVKKGKHTLQVRALDSAGNVDASPSTSSWTYKKKRKRK